MITRRLFLQGLGVIVGTVVLDKLDIIEKPVPIENEIKRWGNIKITEEYGNAIPATQGTRLNKDIAKILIDDARKTLPKGTNFLILEKMPSNYGRSHGFAWYTNNIIMKGGIPKINQGMIKAKLKI
ncbi:hypothetical protein LCGC14_0514920 [marine sediment metagenome]|uniref:Uncharacterized protein n=1 Tax=marine sediment metagenome TaxID=412755 RepID=A0A0F9ULL5_9ZZZZ|nr:hypothetical protein [Candidatus Aminicenantes bacterium]